MSSMDRCPPSGGNPQTSMQQVMHTCSSARSRTSISQTDSKPSSCSHIHCTSMIKYATQSSIAQQQGRAPAARSRAAARIRDFHGFDWVRVNYISPKPFLGFQEPRACSTVARGSSARSKSCMSAAVAGSTLAVHSSRHTMRGRCRITRARHTSCCWPAKHRRSASFHGLCL